MTANRPGLFQIGRVSEQDGHRRAYGWGIQLCMARCSCHRPPSQPHRLTLLEDPAAGRLGLASADPECDCCEPWTIDELIAIGHDFAWVEELPTVETA